jgi:hypothetical protein
MIAYFDTQAFDHIYQKVGCTSVDIGNLRKAIYGRKLSIRLSIHALEEILLGRKVSPQTFAAQIKLTLSLASARTLVKPCGQLLFDDIRAYAARGEAERPFLRGDVQNMIADGIAALVESDGEELEDEFVEVLQEARQDKAHFFTALEHARQAAETISTPSSGWTSFEPYFETAALPTLDALAEQAGVAAGCRERGLNGLLKIKSVGMSIGAALAMNYAEISGASAPGSNALHHAVAAAAVAEIFVSETPGSRDLLGRIEIEALNFSGLPEFLKDLSSEPASDTT